ncbi:DUF1214 domain-containing protein [Rhizobium sp. 57MFTsu3.2]|uniref:DUF1254 domain-containing protein n=1 Tax=Rhizobium sp. 57MFTsu3.2 TaxID=1048681 RepID=UPI001AEE1A9E|nr:DUF1214 domain-containing protein [Rhizobium sp. 57MFTsu3.2]NMN73968.1 hypothetical protein [Rhizobium sp. 57MFTsu3.2]
MQGNIPGVQWFLNRRDLLKQGVATVSVATLATAMTALTVPTAALAQDGQDPLGGQPAKGATPSIKDFDYQIKYQRAFEAVLWNMPAIAIYSLRRAAFTGLGMKDNDIISYSAVATPKLEAITANSTTPYIAAYTDLRKGPVVLELPASGPDGSLYGQVVDAWQFTIADVGPSGLDQGKGGKLLFTPPGYSEAVPDGYIHVASPNYRIAFAFRSVPAPGKTAADAHTYAQRLRMYYLGEAGNPAQQKFVDPIAQRYPTLPFYDGRHFEDMHAIMSVEPVREHDKVMMGMLKSLGIEKGKPFSPDESAKRAMNQAVIDVWYYLQDWYDHTPDAMRFWPDRHYVSLLQADENKTFSFTYDDYIDLIPRAAEFFWCTYMPRVLSDAPATQYMMAMADKDGRLLEAGKLYKLDIPAEMPVKQFWAITVYDRATMSFIYSDLDRTTLSSYELDKMKKNADGGVSIYVGPKAPDGLEANWIPTSGKRPLPAVRFYGPTDAFNNKTFKLEDFELVS